MPNRTEHQRTLLVVRHAKAEPFGRGDATRHLTPRGVVDARALGAWLGPSLPRVDHAIVSSASRTRQTWRHLALGADWDTSVADISDGMYSAGPQDVLEFLWGAPTAARTVVVVGHNPTMTQLPLSLADAATAEPALLDSLRLGMRTAAVAVLGTDVPWGELGEGDAHLLDLHVGRGSGSED